MDYESIFGQTRWQILALIAEKPLSPLEIAGKIKSTISHVSQQLKFLEATGIVVKEKVVNRDKGKPRMLFSLAKNTAHISLLSKGFAGKKLVSLDTHQNILLRIWMLDSGNRTSLEKFALDIEDYLEDIFVWAIDQQGNNSLFVDDVEGMKHKLSSIIKKYRDISCSIVSMRNFSRLNEVGRFSIIYGNSTIESTKEVKNES